MARSNLTDATRGESRKGAGAPGDAKRADGSRREGNRGNGNRGDGRKGETPAPPSAAARRASAGAAPSPDLEMKGKSLTDQPMPPLFRFHGFGPRTEVAQPVGQFVKPGKFGRMFPELQPLDNVPEPAMKALAAAMRDLAPDSADGDNKKIPAGYTYLGQFIDHDITFDTTSIQEMRVDPLAVENFRTPMLDLDCLYGAGPVAQPYLYQRATQEDQTLGFLFEIGKTRQGRGDPTIPDLPNDLPRANNKFALIADPRNDENLVVQQLHLAFLKFHNKVVKGLIDGTIPQQSPIRKTPFEEGRDLVIWHYQWVVLNDFLRKICDRRVVDDVLNNGRKHYLWEESAEHPFLPVEFSGAAYRLGHSMVRQTYNYNRVFSVPPFNGNPPGSLSLLFRFTGLSGTDVPTPSDWIIDWRRFFNVDGGMKPGFSRLIDPFTAPQLMEIPSVPQPFSLPERNLIRGVRLKLPPGQSVARAMGIKPLTANQVADGPDGQVAKQHNLHVESPLWYYILKEAQVEANGEHLGPVGSRIVAEVFIGLLRADSSSFLVRRPDWKPWLPAKSGSFEMADVLRFVDDVNPIGSTSTGNGGGGGS